jgi:HPt (histidine-containing phosphotransfer) domain-containing protein
MDDYLSKPVEMKTLRACLERWLPRANIDAADANMAPPSPVQTQTAGEPCTVLDLSLMAECFGDNEAAIEENLALFLQSMNDDLESLSSAIARCDERQTELTAHRIKGAAHFVGGSKVAAASNAIEAFANIRDWDAVHQEWPQLLEASREIREHIGRKG